MVEFTFDPSNGHPAINCKLHYVEEYEKIAPARFSRELPSIKASILQSLFADGTIDKYCDQYNVKPKMADAGQPSTEMAIDNHANQHSDGNTANLATDSMTIA
ncbi:hypothetical protein [Rhodoligotrophos ferricapiens]|uniref:hypothetical protein n=1 Tax=Rhodoligotrophos ferricapiens TaxID=3069264 RepID=UPI00315CC056